MAQESGGSSGNGALVQIIVAIIGVAGVIAAALFANWEKIFGQPATPVSQPQISGAPGPAPGDPAGAARAATQLSQSQQRALGAEAGALDDVTRQIEGAGQPAASPAPVAAPSAAGMWYDPDGYSFDVRQQGSTISFLEYRNGALIGNGSGEIHGLELRYGFQTNDDRGQCVARLAPAGNQLSGRCQSISGASWAFAVTR